MKNSTDYTDSELVTEAQKTVAKFRKAFNEAQTIASEYGFELLDSDSEILNTVFAKMREQRDASIKANVESVFQSALESLSKKGNYALMTELLNLFQNGQYNDVNAKLLEHGLFHSKQSRKERIPRDPNTPKTLLRVTFPDGRVICHQKVADTLVEIVDYVGPEVVSTLNIVKSSSSPLVAKKMPPKGGKELDGGWFVCTHSSTKVKKRQIEQISDELQLDLKIEDISE